MQQPSQITSYGSVTKVFHWLTALLILAAFPLGMIANNAPIGGSEEIAQKVWLFSLHKTVGVTAFFTALARILWALGQPKPGLLDIENPVEVFLAHFIHWMLYIAMLIVPLSGWLHHSATTGLAPILWPFGQSLPFIPTSDAAAHFFSGLHFFFTKVLLVSVGLHIAGALKHAFIDRDKTLVRMLPFSRDLPVPPEQPHSRVPMVVAAVIFGGAMAMGAVLGAGGKASDPVPVVAATAAAGANGWVVESGMLEITITQFGNPVSGEFTGWNAVIEFDPERRGVVQVGHVRVEVPISGLTLGSVTDQAMGADFFDATEYPAAVYEAEIFRVGEVYEARGVLTLKGIDMPVTLPFTLDLDNGLAKMQGRVEVQRLDFQIGAQMPDEASLKFAVGVEVRLTARRNQ